MTFKPVTGTFLDGVEADVPSLNWSRAEWARQFDVLKEMGMDTVIIIRVGWKDCAMYDSKVMKAVIYDPDDRVALFLDEAQRTGLKLYMGLFDSFKYWPNRDNASETAVNLELIDELMARYGGHPAFYGWYLSHEPAMDYRPEEVWDPLAEKIRRLTPGKPILLSPRYESPKGKPKNERPSPEAVAGRFDAAMSAMTQHIDFAAFMDGHVEFEELPLFMDAMKPVLDRHGIEFWSNLETFDRDVPIRFPPIDWLKMRMKLEAAQSRVEKIITFEAPHFLSPYSPWESGRMLFRRYMEYTRSRGH